MKNKIIYYCNMFSIFCLIFMCCFLYYENSELYVYKDRLNLEEKFKSDILILESKNKELSKNNNILSSALNNVKVKNVNHGLNVNQLRSMIKKVVKYLDENNVNGYTELILTTAIIESNNGYFFKQVKGPALGVFQMEPFTEKCIWDNYLKYNVKLKKKIEHLRGNSINGLSQLETNISYAIAMTYAHYKRTRKNIPNINNKLELVKFHKKYYNTEKGKSKIDVSLDKIVGVL